jgi:hypothetical protein
MDDRFDMLHADVKEIKSFVIELVKQGAIHNQTLIEHERRSTNLEERFKPLETDHSFIIKLAKGIILLGAVFTALKVILQIKNI